MENGFVTGIVVAGIITKVVVAGGVAVAGGVTVAGVTGIVEAVLGIKEIIFVIGAVIVEVIAEIIVEIVAEVAVEVVTINLHN